MSLLGRIFITTLALILQASPPSAQAATPSVLIPLDESKSEPASDLISKDGIPQDPGRLSTSFSKGFDSSDLQPKVSDIYSGQAQPLVQKDGTVYPDPQNTFIFQDTLPYTRGLARARIALPSNPNVGYQLNFSLDSHATLARSALLRALGYTIPSPRYYPQVTVQFASIAERDRFLDLIADKTLTGRGRWVVGGLDEIGKNKTAITFQDVVLEPALIAAPQLHWGILSNQVLNKRRSLRALIAPLTLLDIPESVNMLSYETAKISNDHLEFSRPYADAFANATSIGDVRWITKKMAALTRTDWTNIIQAGHYPPDIQALLVEKAIGRALQLFSILRITPTTELQSDPYVTSGQVINGKAMQESYDGYALRFTYGDPKSPLRASELLRFFGIQAISAGLDYLLGKVNDYLQLATPDKYITAHNDRIYQDLVNHIQNNPNEPYVQPFQVWGGPIAGGSAKASRSIVTGTYYGSKSAVQLVDSVTASVAAGAFIGVSGIPRISLSASPQVQYQRSYLHVRPILDIKTAWKDNWKNVYVPKFMKGLADVLNGDADQTSADAIKAFLDKMETGEIFMITDGFAAGTGINVGIPLGAIMGFLPPFSNLSESVTVGNSYGILSRTTIYKSSEGIQVYLSRVHSKNFELTLDTNFFIKLISISSSHSNGQAHTQAYLFPDKFDSEAKEKAFQRSLVAVFRNNNPDIMEEEFYPYALDHDVHGGRFRFQIGPWSWVNRVNYHLLDIVPPFDPEKRYDKDEFKRSVVQGQITKIQGSDPYGFFGRLLNRVLPFVNIGQTAVGDDPATNFLGKSKTFAVSTELELTKSKANNTFTTVSMAYNGWSMKKNKLLRLVNEMSKEVEEFNPNGKLVSREQFSQTRKIQAYTVMWTLLIYEKGLQRLMNVLDLNQTSTKQVQAKLVDMMGAQKYSDWCENQGYEQSLQEGPYGFDQNEGTMVENNKGRTTHIGCVTPWMATIYNLRGQLKKHPEAFMTEVRDEETAVEKIKWINRTLADLDRDMDLGQLTRWLGKDASHFQIRISGFRTNDEAADSERYSTYFSNSIGTIDPDTLGGPLSDISGESEILDHEIQARYLTSGY